MKQIFNFGGNSNYNLKSGTHLSRPIVYTTHYGTQSITNLGAKIWELVPKIIKEANSQSNFKNKVKKWIPQKYPCRLCKAQVEFI